MTDAALGIAGKLTKALEHEDEELFAALLDPAVRWGGDEETPDTCHGRDQVIARYRVLRENGVGAKVEETLVRAGAVVLALALTLPRSGDAAELPPIVWQVFRLDQGLVVDIRGFPTREDALELLERPS